MAKGGKREGSGRKPGSPNKRSAVIAQEAMAEGITPIAYMLGVLRNEAETVDRRMWAAERAAPYIHPRLAAVEHSGDKDKPIQIETIERVITDPRNTDS